MSKHHAASRPVSGKLGANVSFRLTRTAQGPDTSALDVTRPLPEIVSIEMVDLNNGVFQGVTCSKAGGPALTGISHRHALVGTLDLPPRESGLRVQGLWGIGVITLFDFEVLWFANQLHQAFRIIRTSVSLMIAWRLGGRVETHRHSDSGPLEFCVFSLVTSCPWHLTTVLINSNTSSPLTTLRRGLSRSVLARANSRALTAVASWLPGYHSLVCLASRSAS